MNELCFSAWWSRLSRANSFETNAKTTKGDERKKRKKELRWNMNMRKRLETRVELAMWCSKGEWRASWFNEWLSQCPPAMHLTAFLHAVMMMLTSPYLNHAR